MLIQYVRVYRCILTWLRVAFEAKGQTRRSKRSQLRIYISGVRVNNELRGGATEGGAHSVYIVAQPYLGRALSFL